MQQYIITFLTLAICQITFGQTDKTIIPFQLTSFNNISIRAVLNQKDTVQLMLHTGATDVTLTEEATKRLKSPIFDKTIDGIKSWGGQTDEARVSVHNSLTIEGLRWDSLSITENKHSGQFTDGKIGLDLFKGKFVAIDFEKKVIILSDKLPKRLRGFEKHQLSSDNGFVFIDADCEIEKNNVLTNRFLIHSGYAGSILLDDKFANDNKLNEKLEIVGEKELKDSYGNVIKTKKAIMPALKIGKHPLSDVSVGFLQVPWGIKK
jgi:Aspartyl protease